MKNWRLNNINQSAFEKTGPVPRSITKTFEKFKKELEPNSESEIITNLNQTDTYNIYSASISNDKLQNDPYRVSINYETKPIITESTHSKLMDQFGREEVVEEMIDLLRQIMKGQSSTQTFLIILIFKEKSLVEITTMHQS